VDLIVPIDCSGENIPYWLGTTINRPNTERGSEYKLSNDSDTLSADFHKHTANSTHFYTSSNEKCACCFPLRLHSEVVFILSTAKFDLILAENSAGLNINTGSTKSFQRFADTGLNLGSSVVDMVIVTKFVRLGDVLTSLNNETMNLSFTVLMWFNNF